MLIYHPYVSDKPKYKYFIITKDGRRVYFGAKNYEDYTIHKDDKRKEAYISRHKKREDWTISGIDTAGFWSRWFLWEKPTKKEALEYIKSRFL